MKTTTRFLAIAAILALALPARALPPIVTPPGAKVSGSPTTNNCAKWINATTVGDAGSVCGSGGTGTVTTTGTPASGNLAKFSGATSIVNGNLAGDVTTAGTLTTTVAAIAGTTVSGTSGSGNVAFTTSPVFTTPNLGTPSTLVGTNISGTAASLTAGHVTTNANLTGVITSVGNATSIAAQTGTGTTFVMDTSPVLVTPNLGTPSAGVLTNASGTAASLTAGHVTTNANLTGVITSVGNATSIAAQTGTGTTFAMDTSPVLVTPSLGVTTVTGTGAASTSGMIFTGLPFVGTGTTSFPLLFVQPTGGTPPTASTSWSTSGTVFGANVHTGTIGNFLDLQVDGVSKASIQSNGTVQGVALTSTGGNITGSSGAVIGWTGRGGLTSPAAAKVQLGTAADASTATAQFLKVQNVVAGTTDTAGAAFNIEGSQGTGTGVGGSILLRTAPAGTTGTGQNAEQTALTIDQKSHIGLSSAAIPTIGTCGTGSPTVTAGSTDNAGEFTVGTTATACTLTFKQTFTSQPFCVLSDKTSMVNLLSFTISTSAIVLTMTSNSGNVVEYHCSGI